MSLIVGSDKQLVELVVLKRLKSVVHEKRQESITSQKYSEDINSILSLYSLVEDYRFDMLMKKALEDEILNETLNNVRKIIKDIDSYSLKSKMIFIVVLALIPFFIFALPDIFTWELFLTAFLIGLLYLTYARAKIRKMYTPLRLLLLNIIENSEPTYGKKSI